MKTQTKTILLLILTFILGAMSGAVVQKILIKKEFHRFSHRVRDPDGFVRRFEEIIDPTEDQRDQIRTILEKHHKEMMRFQTEFPMRMDSLRNDLNSILTEEQKNKLKNSRWFKGRPGRRFEGKRRGRRDPVI